MGGLLVAGVRVGVMEVTSYKSSRYGGALIFKGKCTINCFHNRLKMIS